MAQQKLDIVQGLDVQNHLSSTHLSVVHITAVKKTYFMVSVYTKLRLSWTLAWVELNPKSTYGTLKSSKFNLSRENICIIYGLQVCFIIFHAVLWLNKNNNYFAGADIVNIDTVYSLLER